MNINVHSKFSRERTLKIYINWQLATSELIISSVQRRFIIKLWNTQYSCHQFLSISYWGNSEFWSQKCTHSGCIHSTKLDVYVWSIECINSLIGLLFGTSWKSEKKFKFQIGVRPLFNTWWITKQSVTFIIIMRVRGHS